MSHVALVDLEITDLDDLAAAAKAIGLEFVPGQQTYRWYGQHVGDYPLPPGFQEDDLGKCEHALRIPQPRAMEIAAKYDGLRAFEIGVCRRRDGKPGWTLIWDFIANGFGLVEVAGENLGRLKQAYAIQAARRTAIQQGFSVSNIITQPDGSQRLVLTKRG